MSDQLLKDSTVADMLATTVKTLEDWRLKRKGPTFVKLGRSVRYKMSDLQAYIAQLGSQPQH